MSYKVPNGAIWAIAATYGAAIPVTALTNAAPPQATAAAHGLLAADILEVTSGWQLLSGRAARVAPAPTANNFGLENIDATNTSAYGIGGGVGSVRKVLSWTQLDQVLTAVVNGGDQNFATIQPMAAQAQIQIPTFRAATSLAMSIGDDPTLAGFILAGRASDDGVPRILRATLKNGETLYYNGIFSLNRSPSMTVNEVMACALTVSLQAEVTRYAAPTA